MLRSLTIKNYVLIDSLDIEFPAGLVIITGQTGAGKSIILGALSLALGAKADSSAIGENGDNCVVEAEFIVRDENGRTASLLAENDIDFEPDPQTGEGSLIIRRMLSRNGRSRSFVNDSPVPVKVLSALSSTLVDIHSQHETMMLRDKTFQMSMLDCSAGDGELLHKCAEQWKACSALKSEYRDVCDSLERMTAEKEYNQAQFDSLESAKLSDGELEELEAEQKRLANAEDIKRNLYQVEQLFSPEEGEGDGQGMSVDSALKESVKLLDKVSAFIPAASGLSSRVESSRLELDDVLAEVSALESATDVSGERLQQVEDRISLIYGLLKKHSCGTVGELVELKEKFAATLSDTTGLELRKSALEKEIAAADKAYLSCAGELHSAREKALKPLSETITESLHSLELDRAVFDVVLEPSAPSASGTDSVLFRFSSTGKDPVDVARCASGGELSRIMLCLKAQMARYVNMPSMIFDEIDTGVSGSAADKMGAMICSMGTYMQVFAITHLPQVAAKGDAHYIVTKSFADGKAVTGIRRIQGEERVGEIARLLSGSRVTPEAVANARAILGE